MILAKLITEKEAIEKGWSSPPSGRGSGFALAAYEDKSGIVSLEQIDPSNSEIVKKIQYEKDTNKLLFSFDKKRDGDLKKFEKDFKRKNKK